MAKKYRTTPAMRWHSRVGVALFWLLVLLSLTGIALNHTDRLGLAKISLRAPLLLDWYGLDAAPAKHANLYGRDYHLQSYYSGEQPVGSLYSDGRAVAACPPPLHSALALPGEPALSAVLCNDELLLITADGQLLDSWQVVAGLPGGLRTLSWEHQRLVGRRSDGSGWALDTDQFIATAVATAPAQANSLSAAPAAGVSLQTLLLDLHSGRLFGAVGIWAVDIAGLLFCVLALTGLWSVVKRPR